MSTIQRSIGARLSVGIAAIALAAAACGSGQQSGQSGQSGSQAATAPSQSPKASALHDTMRVLWQDHGTWTRLAIVSFADNSPDLQATQDRLLANQTDIGNAVKPYYGDDAGNKLTALLQQHIQTAVGVLKAAKTGNPAEVDQAKAAFYANGNQIADFLHGANPGNWPLPAVQNMMKTHLDQVVEMGSDELTHHYAESVGVWNPYRDHILAMADTLSNGITKQFPNQFS
jgi:hypothetical protein